MAANTDRRRLCELDAQEELLTQNLERIDAELNGQQTALTKRFSAYLEIVRNSVLEGWVVNIDKPFKPTKISIDVDGRQIAQILAGDLIDRRLTTVDFRQTRPELREQVVEKSLLPARLSYSIPECIRRGTEHRVTVTAHDGRHSEVVFCTTDTLDRHTTRQLKDFFSDFRSISLHAKLLNDGRVRLFGWMSLPEPIGDDITLAVNGQPLAGFKAQLRDGQPSDFIFSFWKDRPTYGFEVICSLSDLPSSDRGYKIQGIEKASGAPYFPPGQTVYLPHDYEVRFKGDLPVPAAESIARTDKGRVIDIEPERQETPDFAYLFSGAGNMWNFEDVIQACTGQSYSQMARVLDWGCGCGRLTQHLAELKHWQVFGCDIDGENVDWCHNNIAKGEFRKSQLDPPLPYEDGMFDLVIGISIFTHLAEEDQFRWLQELHRVLRKGGIMAVTVAGYNALKRQRLRNVIRYHEDMERCGFSDRTIGNLLNSFLGEDSTYYRNTRHLPDYIYREWSRWFDIKAVDLGTNNGQQDLVVGVKT